VEVLSARNEGVERAHQVATHRAADAPVIHGHNVLFGLDLLDDKALVDVDLAKLKHVRCEQFNLGAALLV
jgi:hypothetical protein